MNRTTPGTLAVTALIGAVLAWMLESWLHAQGRPMLIPALTLPVVLLAVAVLLVVFAWPVRRYTKWLHEEHERAEQRARRRAVDGDPDTADDLAPASRDGVPARPDPFVALRLVAFAKASSLSAALLSGSFASMLVYVLTRSFIETGSAWECGVSLLASIVLLVAALLVERWCSLPPSSPGQQRQGARGTA